MDKQHLKRQHQAKILRIARKLHRTTGALLFLFFLFISVSGLLLGWKKHSGDVLLPKTYKGSSADLRTWLPTDSLHTLAVQALHRSVSPGLSAELDRIDMRPDKGTVKFSFAHHYWGIQLDGATGQVLHIGQRRADFIEQLHDGSVIDRAFGWSGGWFKLAYTTVTALALLLFTITGFWLWYGPKQMRGEGRGTRGGG